MRDSGRVLDGARALAARIRKRRRHASANIESPRRCNAPRLPPMAGRFSHVESAFRATAEPTPPVTAPRGRHVGPRRSTWQHARSMSGPSSCRKRPSRRQRAVPRSACCGAAMREAGSRPRLDSGPAGTPVGFKYSPRSGGAFSTKRAEPAVRRAPWPWTPLRNRLLHACVLRNRIHQLAHLYSAALRKQHCAFVRLRMLRNGTSASRKPFALQSSAYGAVGDCSRRWATSSRRWSHVPTTLGLQPVTAKT